MSVHTANFTAEWKPGGSWVDITAYVLQVSGDFETTGASNGIAFGDSSTARATITLDPLRVAGSPLSTAMWELVPMRITFTVDAHTAKGAAGVIVSYQQNADELTYTVEGYQRLISRTRVYSPLFQRTPVATATTAASIENPATTGYAAGPINYALWQAGGRPYEQAASYPSAAFFYTLQQALIAPDWSWLSGEDAWEACLKLVRAAGGQLYQRPDGVIAYVTPLSLANGSNVFSLGHGDYARVSRSGQSGATMATITAPYQGRFKAGMQEVVDDTTPRVVGVGATVTIELEPKYPLFSLETVSGLVPASAISATCFDGVLAKQSTHYTHTLDVKAQRVTIVITSVANQPFVIEKVALRGIPIAPGEAGTITVGSGQPMLTLEQNEFVQSRAHAARLSAMALAFFSQARPIITVSGVLYNPSMQIGDIGTLTFTPWGMSATPIVILSIKHSQSGIESELQVIDITGLPKLSDYFLVSTTSQAGLTKKIGY